MIVSKEIRQMINENKVIGKKSKRKIGVRRNK